MQHTLEGHRSFKAIAWTTIILFALFVGIFTLQAKEELTALDTARNATEAALLLDLERQSLPPTR